MSDNPHGQITILAPNGTPLQEEYRPHDTVGKTLDHALEVFGRQKLLDPSGAYILVLGNTPLDTSMTLEQVGVKPGDTLKVRAKSIPTDGTDNHASRTL